MGIAVGLDFADQLVIYLKKKLGLFHSQEEGWKALADLGPIERAVLSHWAWCVFFF
jgi:hypothetical protein